jgi:hypothetical protein
VKPNKKKALLISQISTFHNNHKLSPFSKNIEGNGITPNLRETTTYHMGNILYERFCLESYLASKIPLMYLILPQD